MTRFLRAYVRRRRRWAVAHAAGWAVATSIAIALLACTVDRAWPLPPAVRAVALAGAVVVAVVTVARPVGRWFHRADLVLAAVAVERAVPAFDHQLVTAASSGDPGPMRDELCRRVVATIDAVGRPPVPAWPAAVAWATATVALLLVAGLWRWPWLGLPDLARRLAHPTAPLAAVTATRLSVRPVPATLPDGDPLTVTADRTAGTGPVTLHLSADDGQTWSTRPMTAAGGPTFTATVPDVTRDLRLCVTAGDAVGPTTAVRVRHVPALAAVRARYEFPAATGRPPLTVADAATGLVAPAGTTVTVDLTATVPLSAATLDVGPRRITAAPTADPRVRRARLVLPAGDVTIDVRLTAADGTAGRSALPIHTSVGPIAGFDEQERAYRAATRP